MKNQSKSNGDNNINVQGVKNSTVNINHGGFSSYIIKKKKIISISLTLTLTLYLAGSHLYTRALKYNLIGEFHHGLATVNVGALIGGKWGYIDRNYNQVIPLIYDHAGNFTEEGLAKVTIGDFINGQGRSGFIDNTGKEVVPLQYGYVDDFSEGLAVVMRGDLLHDVVGFFDGEAPLEKYGYVDKTGKEVIPVKFTYAESFSDGLAKVSLSRGNVHKIGTSGKFGFINRKGNLVIPMMYDEAESFSNGKATVKLSGRTFIINKRNNIIDE